MWKTLIVSVVMEILIPLIKKYMSRMTSGISKRKRKDKQMKSTLAVLLFLSSAAFGSGKLSVQGNYFLDQKTLRPVIGFAIHEKLIGPISYSGWTGIGWQPKVGASDVFWVTSRHDLEVWLGNVGISTGITLRHAQQPLFDGEMSSEHDVHVKLVYKLW
jgi:hypothetical protein